MHCAIAVLCVFRSEFGHLPLWQCSMVLVPETECSLYTSTTAKGVYMVPVYRDLCNDCINTKSYLTLMVPTIDHANTTVQHCQLFHLYLYMTNGHKTYNTCNKTYNNFVCFILFLLRTLHGSSKNKQQLLCNYVTISFDLIQDYTIFTLSKHNLDITCCHQFSKQWEHLTVIFRVKNCIISL